MSRYIDGLSDGQNDAVNSEFASYQHDIDMMLEENEMLKSHVAHLTTALKEARQAEMEACCRDVCQSCANGKYTLYQDAFGRFMHVNKSDETIFCVCDANPIRQRWQQQGQGQEERSAGE